MTIEQLNKNELQELDPFNELTREELTSKYSGINFVKEDFFCNI